MKKVLFITYNNPEKSDNGDKRYTWDILQALKKNNEIYVHIVAYYEEEKEKNIHYIKLENLCDKVTYIPFKYKNLLRIGLSFYPAMIANRKTKKMIDSVRQILKNESYDVIYVNMFRMAYIVEYIKEFQGKKIFISHNVEFLLSKSTYRYATNIGTKIAYYLDYLKTKYWEKRYLSQYDSITAICDVDVETYKNILNFRHVFLLPPIVNMTIHHGARNNTNILIVCGAFTWTPKIINLRKLLNAKNILDISKYGCKLHIIGRANEQEIDYGNKIPNVFLSGEVPTVEPYYKDASVALVPELVGGGFKLKIAEAVQHHLPIVAIKGSVTDKQMVPNIHYIEAADFEELINKGIELIKNQLKRKELDENATMLFMNRYSIDYVHNQLINNM
jgi:glycosyltransferase involved in cell wall biosynthesis